ncbi:hypothetical protein [Streptomyces sp. URMC 125]|uniref:hypothetical protein n=1 Tax=Streptomyces sp. URMC 125 TaxID=3423419 RepID=UPI003F1C8B08
MYPVAQREYRVWNEAGDLLGLACVYPRRYGWVKVEVHPYDTSSPMQEKNFRREFDAYEFAEDFAHTCKAQAISDCPCEPGEECGVLHPHGISVQICEDGDDITHHYV